MGRPSKFTQALADEICERIARGASLVKILKDDHMPEYPAVMRWLEKDESFRENYAHAREARADHYADEIVDIVDDCEDPAKARLQMDARKWYAGKLKPKRYGDKLGLEGPEGGPIQVIVQRLSDS